MKAGPSESASKSGLQTTPSCCGQKPSVVSVGVKASGPYPEQVWIKETNKLEPLLKRREEHSVVETRDLNPSWDKLAGQTWLLGKRRPAYRRREFNPGSRAELREPVAPMLKGEAQVAETTRREYRSGALGRTNPYERGRPCNGAGAKGLGQAVAFAVQLETGGS